ncbi:MAG: UPF0149 family protein [Candidatus Eisenbacteria bacterium]|nr:UPF0149 family protein [Candidatus Eisenbacteria bacterium]
MGVIAFVPFAYRVLDEFLTSDARPEDCLVIDEVHGLLTSVICGPCIISPSEWMQVIGGGEFPEFTSEAEAKEIIHALFTMHNEIAETLFERREFAPLAPTYRTDAGETRMDAEGWCYGFLLGVDLRADTWLGCEHPDLGALLFPITCLGLMGSDPEVERLMEEPGAVEQAAEMVPEAVMALYEFWRCHEQDPYSERSRPPGSEKVGRNDPCPCGSGLKYKRCCGKA